LHAQLDAMIAISATNELKRRRGPHAHSVDTIISGASSAKRFDKNNLGAADAAEQMI